MNTKQIQEETAQWVISRLGEKAMVSRERGRRCLEENLELGQALEVTREEAHRLVDHVYDKPVGNPNQELGGCALTLLAAAESLGVHLGALAVLELNRVTMLPMEKFQKRQSENIENGIGE